MHDLVIRGGHIVDGTGGEAFTADVAVKDGVIVEIGKVGRGYRELKADGLLVTPGFVDVHTHYDAQVTWDETLTPSAWHGVTTAVMGNCGVGFAPVHTHQHEWLIGLMEGVEDIPGAALSEGITWGWESFGEYLDVLDRRKTSIDFATQVPHGAVRGYIMGERGANNEAATHDDITQMAAVVQEAIAQGAFGFSTSRTMLHRAIDGRLVPGTYAAEDELFALGRAVRDGGGRLFQVACEHAEVPAELEWMGQLSKEFDLDVMFNLSQVDQAPDLWRVGFEKLAQLNREGARLKAQVAGRSIGIMMSFAGTAHPFALKPAWLGIKDEPWTVQQSHLRDEHFVERLLKEPAVFIGEFEKFVTESFHKMFDVSAGYEPKPSDSLAARAQERGTTPQLLALDTLRQHDGQGMLYFPLFNYSNGSLDPLHTLHQSEHVMMGLSDAGAHCGAVCDGGMPTFMLTHWSRDRDNGLPLELVVARQTRDTAHQFGLRDRGVIQTGKRADINLIDYENLRLDAPEMHWDLPAGGRRLTQRARGYVATLCRGKVTIDQDVVTDERPGRLVRRGV